MTATWPTTVVPARTSMRTSPSAMLGRPKRPKTKNGTETPLIGSCSARLVLEAPVAVLRNTIAPAVAAELLVSVTLTSGVIAPEAFDSRMRQGDGAHERYRARGSALLLICKSTVIGGSRFGATKLPRQAMRS